MVEILGLESNIFVFDRSGGRNWGVGEGKCLWGALENLGVSKSGSSPYEQMIIIEPSFCKLSPIQDASPIAAQALSERFCSRCRLPIAVYNSNRSGKRKRASGRASMVGCGKQRKAIDQARISGAPGQGNQ
jgi:hypothetical protein